MEVSGMRKSGYLCLIPILLPALLSFTACGKKAESGGGASGPAQTQAGPQNLLAGKTVTINVQHAAGSSTDIIARGLQPNFSKAFGSNVIIENLGGGGGNQAHSATYRAKPDGLTLEITIFPSILLGELTKDGEFKSLEFSYISKLTGGDYNNWFVPADSPFQTMQDLINASKTRRLTFGGPGIGTNSHAMFILFLKEAGLNIQYVAFDGGPQAAVAAMGHHVDVAAGNEIICKQAVADGTMRVLMINGPDRQPEFPGTPTAKELGYENAIMEVCMGLIGPPGMDPAMIKYIDEVTAAICADPEVMSRIKALGSTIAYENSETFRIQAEKMYQQAALVAPDIKAIAMR
jgi:tripartite-type tricarboxylate transporter receptor subunit TctC